MEPRVPTSAGGRFRVVAAVDGVYRVIVRESASVNSQELARLEDVRPDTDPLHIVIRDSDRPSAFLRGRLVRPPGFEDHLVRLSFSSDKPGISVMEGVGLDGKFRVGPLTPGRYEVSPIVYQTPLGGFSFPEVELGPGEEVDLGVIHISPPTWLVVSIRYQDGSQVEESALSLFDLADQGWNRRSMDRWVRGSIRPDTYDPGRYRLDLISKQHLPWSRDIELVEGQTTTVEAIVERARGSRIVLVLEDGVEVPDTLQIEMRRDGSKDERTIQLLRGERLVAVGLGTYTAEIRDEQSPLRGSVRFVVSDLQGPELRIQLPAR